jgi:hypothetical protein
VNYKEYFFTNWLDFSETHYIINVKGIPIQVRMQRVEAAKARASNL